MANRQYCLTLDLFDDEELILEYERYHQQGNVWPEVLESIRDSGILSMNIHRLGTSLCMVIEVNEQFSFESKAESDKQNPKVQEWEKLMEKFQNPQSQLESQQKWQLMSSIFTFNS